MRVWHTHPNAHLYILHRLSIYEPSPSHRCTYVEALNAPQHQICMLGSISPLINSICVQCLALSDAGQIHVWFPVLTAVLSLNTISVSSITGHVASVRSADLSAGGILMYRWHQMCCNVN